ncbi:hypothetical protein [Vibrio sp. bablab_jr001]|uniref:hypothetical protein n=1 Tax=Vibrio sp. bablab_jr001 TaxID=2755067 RepID=UPI0018F25343|nr:hypothetical protein [Vibrio sp. bablab_jr001]
MSSKLTQSYVQHRLVIIQGFIKNYEPNKAKDHIQLLLNELGYSLTFTWDHYMFLQENPDLLNAQEVLEGHLVEMLRLNFAI